MSDPTSILPSSTTAAVQSPDFKKDGRQALLAALVSAVLPGAGHFLINRRRTGIVLLILFCALLSICWPLRLLTQFPAVIGLVFGMLALCITVVVNSAYGRWHGHARPSQWWLLILLPVAFAVAFIHANWAVRAAGFQVFGVPSRSMETTIPLNAHVMVDKWYYKTHSPWRGDIVIFLDPRGLYLVKRVIARGGETIRSSNGIIFINDVPIPEPYVIHSGSAPLEMNSFGPLKIPAGRFFAMGDSRDISLDSRSPEIGLIEVAALRGRALYTIGGFRDRTYKTLQ